MPVLRLTYALAATALVVWLLIAGLPIGALAVVIVGVALRRRAEALLDGPA